MEARFECYYPDMEAMHHGFQSEFCFVCRMVQGDVRFPEYIIYEDERALVFLDGYPRACYELGQKSHRNADFTVSLVPSRSLFPAFLSRF